MPHHEYTTIRELHGGQNKVILAERKGKYYALKLLQLSDLPQRAVDAALAELRLLRTLKHEHIVKLRECEIISTNNLKVMMIATDFAEGGSLAQLLAGMVADTFGTVDPIWLGHVSRWFAEGEPSGRRAPSRARARRPAHSRSLPALLFPPARARAAARRSRPLSTRPPRSSRSRAVVSALQYCHENRVIHRDLKLENVLVSSDGHALLADFGFARELSPSGFAQTLLGTPLNMAPELWGLEGRYGVATDLWALGCMLFELVGLKHPFERASDAQTLKTLVLRDERSRAERIAAADVAIDFVVIPAAMPAAMDLLATAAALLAQDPKDRPTCAELLACSRAHAAAFPAC